MSNRRLKIFIWICFLCMSLCIGRLAYIQLNPHSAWQSQLEKLQIAQSKNLGTLRGRILDRNGKVLATDEAKFALCIDYKFARLADERFWQVQLMQNSRNLDTEAACRAIQNKFADDFNNLNRIIYECAQFKNLSTEQVKQLINERINEPIWQLRYYLAWKRRFPNQKFEEAIPDANERLLLAAQVNVAEMYQSHELFKLENDDEVFAAQLKFLNVAGVSVMPMAERFYPFKNSAAQLIGWVRPATPEDNLNSNNTPQGQEYMTGDFLGFCGIEGVYESLLRGSRGRIVYDIEKEIVSKKETRFGSDIKLTLDIELQKKIEAILKNENLNPNFGKPIACVVIDVDSTDIIASVSLPDFDLNKARFDYSKLISDKNNPIINRVIEKHYPPGSTIKPFILAIGMAENKITAEQVISCPSTPAPAGWPNCWILRSYGYGHDQQWAYEGGNKARNALKGSCNIYFSRLASDIPPEKLQQWLYKFGFGKALLSDFKQTCGVISSSIPGDINLPFEQLPPLDPAERRFFGIGQGNIRATVLQVANAFAAIARKGVFKKPRILSSQQPDKGYTLGLNSYIISTIYDGMNAVVAEEGGTAYKQFAASNFEERGIKVYGKTGSTERPYNAWFAGFAEDTAGRAVAIAVLVEGGQHGASDAAPIARDIISLCAELGYIGR